MLPCKMFPFLKEAVVYGLKLLKTFQICKIIVLVDVSAS